MGRTHPSTPEQRVQWASQMLAHAHEYGFVTALSRTIGVSRPTLYAWKIQAHQALEQTFVDTTVTTVLTPALERQILTLLVEGHNSYSNIQTCLLQLTAQRVSIGTIGAVVHQAQQRALDWMASHAPATTRTLALDEIYATNRRGAYLSVVDTISWAVWAAEGPLAVDSESWTLLLWLTQERGLRWHATVSDGAAAIQAACQIVDPHGQHGRDVWHVFHTWSQIQQRLERHLGQLQARTARVERQAARVAAGQKPRGHHPRSDVSTHLVEVRHAQRTVDDLAVLGQELHRLLAVVVLAGQGLVSLAQRAQDLDTLVDLLSEVQTTAPSAMQADLKRLHTHLRLAQAALLTFVAPLDAVHQAISPVVGPDGLALIAWAWLRRALLAWDTEQLVAGVPQAWRAAARVLIHAWETATRASSAVENWHSILRPHLAVHRTLSPGLLALLAVWHNHRIFTRGVHTGHSPLHLSGMGDAPTDWLVALGYPPVLTHARRARVPLDDLAMAA